MEEDALIHRKKRSFRIVDECGGKSIMEVFDDNILTEILLNLPLNMKLRCKAVCKRWLRLISTPFFRELALARGPRSWYFLYHHRYLNYNEFTEEDLRYRVASEYNTVEPTIQSFLLNFLPSRFQYSTVLYPTVYATHNGLILCSKKEGYGYKDELYVCNPLTGEWVSIPESQISSSKLVGFMVSCNNGSTSFKVVRVIDHFPNYRGLTFKSANFEVFSSNVGEWRNTGVAVPEIDKTVGRDVALSGVVHEGKLFWMVEFNSERLRLLAYDPEKNECRLQSFKIPVRVRFGEGLIGVSCGHLCYVNSGRHYVCVCILENYETEKCRALLSGVLDVSEINQIDRKFSMIPLAFHPFDMNIVYFIIKESSSSGRRIVSFNIRTKKFISYIGEEIRKGSYVRRPISLFVVPWPPISLGQPSLDSN